MGGGGELVGRLDWKGLPHFSLEMYPQNSSHPEYLIVDLHLVNETFPFSLLSLPGAKRLWNIVGTTLYRWEFFRLGAEVRRQKYSRKPGLWI